MKKIAFILILSLLAIFTQNAQAATVIAIGRHCSWGVGFDRYNMQEAQARAQSHCLKHHCTDGKVAGRAVGGGYGAMALGLHHNECQYGFALNQWSQKAAVGGNLQDEQSAGQPSPPQVQETSDE